MSSLWTPEGERRVGPASAAPGASGSAEGRPAPAGGGGPQAAAPPPGTDEEVAAQLAELRAQLVATPVEVVVANHAYGLFELAAIHLSERPPRFEQARLAIDALAALVEGLAGRLGETEPSLTDALAQLRLAFVQLQSGPGGGSEAGGGADVGAEGGR